MFVMKIAGNIMESQFPISDKHFKDITFTQGPLVTNVRIYKSETRIQSYITPTSS